MVTLDLNQLDYPIWDSLSEKVYRRRIEKFTENKLREKIPKKWNEISLGEYRNAIGSFKIRLRAVCEQEGGHIKSCLNNLVSEHSGITFSNGLFSFDRKLQFNGLLCVKFLLLRAHQILST